MGRLPSRMHAPSLEPARVFSKYLSRRQILGSAVAGGAWLLLGRSRASAAGPNQADDSMQAKEAAEKAIPFDKLKPETRAKLLSVVDRPSLYRRLPIQAFDCDHEMHVFLVRYPEVVVNIWQLMGITSIQAKRVSDFTIEGNDGAGTVSRIDLVYGTPDLHLFYCEGSYEGSLFKRKLTGRSVLLLRSGYGIDRAKRPIVTDQLDVFLTIDNAGAELVAKTLHTTVGRTIDANFVETTRFLTRISEAAERNGPGMPTLAAKLNNCQEEVRRDFSEVSTGVSVRNAERVAALTVPATGQIAPAGIQQRR